jgi:hypothetical protein
MAAAKKSDEKQISIVPAPGEFPKVMFFNRFHFERNGSSIIIFFGLLDRDDILRDTFACALDQETVDRHKEDLLRFVAKTASAEGETPQDWRPKGSAVDGVRVANVIRGARKGSLGEIRLLNFSIGDALEVVRESNPSVTAYPIALLRSDAQLQRELFLSLYADET